MLIFFFKIPILFHPSWRNVFWLKSWVKIAVLGVAGMEEKIVFIQTIRNFENSSIQKHNSTALSIFHT